jgi:hypothetical protein
MTGRTFWNWFGSPRFRPHVRARPLGSRIRGRPRLEELENRLTPSAVGTANENFIARVYLDLLGRSPDATGLATWSSKLDQGVSAHDVVLAIAQSTEYRTLQVESFYHRFLNRTADPDGLNANLAFLQNGGQPATVSIMALTGSNLNNSASHEGSSQQLAASMLGSPEYFQKSGGTNDGFLNALYTDVLGRTIDPTGRAGWDQMLAAGASRQDIASLVLLSAESLQGQVEQHYEYLLFRPADAAGLATMTALLGSAGDEAVVAAIAGLSEFFQLAQQGIIATMTTMTSATTAVVSPSNAPGTVTFTETALGGYQVAQQTVVVTNGMATFTGWSQYFGYSNTRAAYTSSNPAFTNSQSNPYLSYVPLSPPFFPHCGCGLMAQF